MSAHLPTAGVRAARLRPEAAGALASVAASVLFAVIFLLAARLPELTGVELTAWRVLVATPMAGALLLLTGRPAAAALARRLRRRPALLLLLALDGGLLSVQLAIFAWAPQSGQGLEASLGYLLLPLVMVVAGLAQGERMHRVQAVAVGLAVIGVGTEVLVAGGVSWVTATIALGYPLYFVVRRRAALDSSAAFLGELLVLVPIAVAVLVAPHHRAALAASPGLLGGVLLLAVLGSVAFLLYLAASVRLPFGVFGLLTYLEPALLVVVSVAVLGEPLRLLDGLVFGPIVAALGVLAAARLPGVRGMRGHRRRLPAPGPDAPTVAP